MLGYGVKDFIIKPLIKETFIEVLKSAIMRQIFHTHGIEEHGRLTGNVGSKTINACANELAMMRGWVEGAVEPVLGRDESANFANSVNEFLQNSFEHGSLGITEETKTELLEADTFDEELHKLEANCKAKIDLKISVLENEITARVTDEGKGFDYEKYLKKTEKDISNMTLLPNGRGIYIATLYFDSVKYSKGGASVILKKSLAGKATSNSPFSLQVSQA